MILRVLLIDTSHEVMIVSVIGLDLQFVISCITEGGTNNITLVLAALAVEREHHLGMLGLRVAYAVLVLYRDETTGKGLFDHPALITPGSVQTGEPHIATADGQHGAGKACKGNGAALPVLYLGPGLDNIDIVVGTVADIDHCGINLVLHAHNGHHGMGFGLHAGVGIAQLGGHAAIGMGHGQRGLVYHLLSESGIEGRAPRRRRDIVDIAAVEPRAEVSVTRLTIGK